MTDTRSAGELLDAIGKRPSESRYSYEASAVKKAQSEFDSARTELRRRLSDAEWARADSDGYRERVLEQARIIAGLEADIARLTRTAELTPEPQSQDNGS